MSRTKRRIANLDPAESYKPQLVTTQWLDNDGVVRTTVHDGNFSPSPQEPTLVFVPAQFCDELYMMRIMEDRKENPQQVENGSYKYLRAAFLSPNSQQSATGKSTIDGNEQNASVMGRISVKTSTISDFSEDFQGFLEPYMDNYEIIFTDAQIDDWLDSGVHTLKVEYNGEVSDTKAFVVGGNALLPNAVPDYDGNWYDAVIIGDQVWTASNLRTTHYADGTEIPFAEKPSWTTNPECYHYKNDSAYDDLAGLFYNWYATVRGDQSSSLTPSGIQGVAPNGWHIPSLSEWNAMGAHIGTYNAKPLASKTGWENSNFQNTPGNNPEENNTLNFNAYPHGLLRQGYSLSNYVYQEGKTAYVANTDGEDSFTRIGIIMNNASSISEYGGAGDFKQDGVPVRCVCDLTTEDFLAWYYNEYGSYNHQIQ